MFVFFSLLASSADGFICGFALGAAGIKMYLKDIALCFFTVFLCCAAAAGAGRIFSGAPVYGRLNGAGAVLMFLLAIGALTSDSGKSDGRHTTATLALSVAADACIVCVYLGLSGHNFLLTAFISAVMHSLLIYAGSRGASFIPSEKGRKIKYLSRAIFFLMACAKLSEAVRC